jgi:glycerophosphoryl diester phosphodiesterase
MKMILMAHRGGVEFGPENLPSTLDEACAHGVACVETDIRQTRDGVLVIHHNPTLGRFDIRQSRYEEIKKHHPDLPTLVEYMETAAGRCQFNLEIKQADPALVLETLEPYGLDRIIFTSFNARILKGLRELAPRQHLGLLMQDVFKMDEAVKKAVSLRFQAVLPFDKMASSLLVDAAHYRGLKVIVWRANKEERIDSLIEREVDGIITDPYTRFRDALRERGREPVTYFGGAE